ncbi:MAG: PAS domain S-box protein, partial [Candidatus Cloacimonadota bacterium]|nr:PAS domain S-box protein [Candidatus Cloacimonadota bacterium]
IGDEFVKKDLRKNIEYYKKLLKQSKSDSSKKIDAIALSNIAISYYKLDQPDESIKFFLQALDYIDKDGQIIDTINILNKIGNICEQQANFMYARKVYREKLELEKKLDNFENIVVTLKKLGQFNMNLSDYDKAIKNYLSALKIIEDNGLEINSIDLYTQIGIIKTKTKNYVVAKEYFEKSLVKVEVKNLIDFGNALNSYAKLDIQNTDYETAKKKIEAAIKIFTTKNHRDGIIQTYKTMGQLLHIQKKYRKAISYFLKVKAMLSEEQNSFEVATIHYLLGSVYLDSGEEENANDEFQSSLFLAKYYDLKELMKDNYLKISKYFQQTHIDTLALEYYKSYSEIKDEILNEKNLQKVSEMRMVFEIEKKEKELKQITSDYNHTKIEKDILNAIVNSIPHPISIKDVNSNYIKTNKEFAHLFNLTPEEMLDKNISEIHDKKLAKVMKEEDVLVKSEKKIMQFEIENEEIDKSLFITKAPLLLNDETTGIVTTIIDISGQKNIQKKLETSENMLKIKNGEKDKFFSILAHDLKNPLSGMIVTLQYLENNFQNIEVNKTKKFISNLNMGINNISNLLEDLLKWAGAQTGRLAFFSIEMDIYKICEE